MTSKLVMSPGFALLTPQKEESQGIVIKHNAEEQFNRGIVVNIGSAIYTWQGTSLTQILPPAKEGETVLYANGYEVVIEGIVYKIAKFADIVGVFTNE